MQILPLLPEHWPTVKTIYEQGIATGHATFQTGAPEWDGAHLKHSRLIALENGQVIGWAALTPVSGRCVLSRQMPFILSYWKGEAKKSPYPK